MDLIFRIPCGVCRRATLLLVGYAPPYSRQGILSTVGLDRSTWGRIERQNSSFQGKDTPCVFQCVYNAAETKEGWDLMEEMCSFIIPREETTGEDAAQPSRPLAIGLWERR
jgi:hypothetical protein